MSLLDRLKKRKRKQNKIQVTRTPTFKESYYKGQFKFSSPKVQQQLRNCVSCKIISHTNKDKLADVWEEDDGMLSPNQQNIVPIYFEQGLGADMENTQISRLSRLIRKRSTSAQSI